MKMGRGIFGLASVIIIILAGLIDVAIAKSPPPGIGAGNVRANIMLALDTSGSMSTMVSQGDSRYPVDLDFDSQGNVYVAKHYDEIEKFGSAGEFLLLWGSTDKGNHASGTFDFIYSIAIDGNDNVYVSDRDNGRVQKFDTNGTYLSELTLGTSGARGVAVDSANNVYVVNSDEHIEVFDTSGTRIANWKDHTGYKHIEVDNSDNVWITNRHGYKVDKYDTSGNLISSFSTPFKPFGITADNNGDLYITDRNSHKVYKYSPTGVELAVWGNYGSSLGEFNSPRGISKDTNGVIWVADRRNHRVQSPDGVLLYQAGSPKSRLHVMRDVIKSIVSDSDLTSGANFGLIEWNTDSSLLVEISDTGASEVFTEVDNFTPGGLTHLEDAMTTAQTYFLGPNTPIVPGADCQQNIIIVISDGHWQDSPDSIAASLYSGSDIATFVVGFATTGNNNYVTLSQSGGTYPDSPLYANNEQMLLEVLSNYIKQVISTQLTFTAPVIIPGINNGDHILQSTFKYKQTNQWKGHLLKYSLDAFGAPSSLLWDAGDKLNLTPADNRSIWTVSEGLDINLNNFTTANAERLKGTMEENAGVPLTDDELDLLIEFVRGKDSYGEFPTGTDDDGAILLTGERWKLADIYNSKIITMVPPSSYASDEAKPGSEAYYRYINGYLSFRSSNDCGGPCDTRKEVIFAGSNSGMMHAFDSVDGSELWAFVPPSVLPNFKDVISSNAGETNAIYGVDGSPEVKDVYYGGSWKTVLMAGLRQGGHSYFALDVTDPLNPSHLFTFSHNVVTNVVSYWASDGTRSDFDATGTVPAEYDITRLGEAWSNPVIVNIPVSASQTKWVAVVAGGFNNGINPAWGSDLFIFDLEDSGKVLQKISLSDTNSANGIVNSVPPRVTSINADSVSSFHHKGALVYVTDLEGKMWKVNLTDQGTLYEATQVFDAQSSQTNGRYVYHSMTASVNHFNTLMLFFGTGDMQNLQSKSASIQNRIHGALDTSFPNYDDVFSPDTVADMFDAAQSCPGTDKGWYLDMDVNEKITAKPTIRDSVLYLSRFKPHDSDICGAGTASISEHDYICGATIRTITNLGEGIATEAVIYNNNIYIGISSDDASGNGSLPPGFTKQGNLIIGTVANPSPGDVRLEAWREMYRE